jgi:hypothetical protein
MAAIRQRFETNPLTDIPGTIAAEFARCSADTAIMPGQRVAVTAGSRGINNIQTITRSIIAELQKIGAEPYIVPAMGSHGGATAEGQAALLDHFGISEASMGVPVRSSMEVVSLGTTDDGIPVFIDRNASEADHIIVVNRVKPHTDFEGVNESGMLKMLAIGLGKRQAADGYHNIFMDRGHLPVLASAARQIIRKSPITFGIGIVEDQLDDTAIIRMIPGDLIESEEQELLVTAKSFLPRIPFERCDLLIVDELGKTFSGTGMDQNVIARTVVPYHVVPKSPVITRIFVRDMSQASGGNALGLGNADFTTRRLVEKINRDVSYMNTFTSSCPEVIRIPPYYDTDEEVLGACFTTLPIERMEDARIVHISNTLHLETMYISENLLTEAEQNPGLEVSGEPASLSFAASGNLHSVMELQAQPPKSR